MCSGMETNVDKSRVMRTSRQQSRKHIMINKKQHKQLENAEYFGYFGSMISVVRDVLVKLSPGLA
jgi:hypothetical protein